MPLLLDNHRTPLHWMKLHCSAPEISITSLESSADSLRIAFINNMPDSAIEDTEAQFFSLLHFASAQVPVVVDLYSLPGVPRGEQARRHLDRFYQPTEKLLSLKYDGTIITGTEPHHSDLREEPYWNSLCDVFKWAEQNTFSAVLSCLAAHAGVLFSDGIQRTPIGIKRFGVFEHEVVQDHALTKGLRNTLRIPHSRWNELREVSLTGAAYSVLSRSAVAGVDLFVKQKAKSLFVHLQGHPEYLAKTLYKEYRRDVRRFLRKERETYPEPPVDYFDEQMSKKLRSFKEFALTDPREQLMEFFPDSTTGTGAAPWQADSILIYGNWLSELRARKDKAVQTSAIAQVAAHR